METKEPEVEVPVDELEPDAYSGYTNVDTIPYDVYAFEIEHYKNHNWEF